MFSSMVGRYDGIARLPVLSDITNPIFKKNVQIADFMEEIKSTVGWACLLLETRCIWKNKKLSKPRSLFL